MLTDLAPVGPTQHRIHAWQYDGLLLETHVLGAELTNSLSKHAHEEYQISYSVTDPSNYAYRRGRHHVPTGSVGVLHPGEVHSSPDLRVRPQASVFHALYVPSARMQQVAAQIAERPVCLPFLPDPTIGDPALAEAFLRLHRTLGDPASRLEQDSRLLAALSRLVTRWTEAPPAPPAVSASSRAMFRARDYLNAHCEENVSLAALSQTAGLSEYHFCRAFGKAVGMPPHQYQTQARIHRAKRLIVGVVPLAQVAALTGFAQQSHSGWHFKRLVGVTPGQYAPAGRFSQTAGF